MSILTMILLLIAAWIISYHAVYHVALFLFKWLMPLKLKHEGKLWFDSWAWAPFTIGFILDIYWNIAHFSIDLWLMNRRDDINNMRFWPNFARVEGIKTLYRITLTERLQFILDTYPTYSKAHQYAIKTGEMLNEYDPEHLTWKK